MRWTLRRLLWILILLYAGFTIYALYYLLVKKSPEAARGTGKKYESFITKNEGDHNAGGPVDGGWNPWEDEDRREKLNGGVADKLKNQKVEKADDGMNKVVEIWGKAAIGQYLWQHIFGEALYESQDGMSQTGTSTHTGNLFRYRTGPGLIPTTIPDDVTHLVLVLNGREQEKIDFAKTWLDHLPRLPSLQRVAVVLLGDEECSNDWLKAYRRESGGLVDMVMVVYDSLDVDGRTTFQWPLGVATYRNFPVQPVPDIDSIREFQCNFAGTVYEDSSRTDMLNVLRKAEYKERCLVNPRDDWVPQETETSMATYIEYLTKSDLTLCPVGKNAESYRIYEAMALGSVPVIEDNTTPGQCAESPHRLLKELNAPVIFVKTWDELPGVLDKELDLSPSEKIARRKVVVRWYNWFKQVMRDRFVSYVDQVFFE